MAAILDIDITVDEASALGMVAELNQRLSAPGISLWMMTEVNDYLKGRTASRFSSEGDDVSGAWAALAPTTISNRTRLNQLPIMIQHATGDLEAYMTENTPQVSALLTGASMTWPGPAPTGRTLYKVGSAQTGNARTGAPARPVMGMDATDAEVILLGLGNYLTERI